MPAVSRPQLVAYALAALVVVVLGVRFMQGQARGSGRPLAGARRGGRAGVRVRDRSPRAAQGHGRARPRGRGGAQPGRLPAARRRARPGRRPPRGRSARGRGPQRDQPGGEGGRRPAGRRAPPRRGRSPRRSAPGRAPARPAARRRRRSASTRATAEQLDTLDGVGPATASKILEYRRQHGGFRSIDDLGEIPGIGPKRLAALRGKVQL